MKNMEASNVQDKTTFKEKIDKLQYKREIEEFNVNLEKGDLVLASVIKKGIVVYGDTRAGKTALTHILSGNSIRGIKKNGQFMVEATTSKNRKAKIGNTMQSETLVPNNFPVKLKGHDINLIDTPGYGDTNGMLTILANGYYHYRLFSKVQNMKFLLCFDSSQLTGTYQDFVNTIVMWTTSFNDYLNPNVKRKIWKSVAFMVTKVEDSPTIKEDLIIKLKDVAKNIRTNHEVPVREAVKQLIQFIIQEDRLFYVKKIKEGESYVEGDLLDRVDTKITDWWTRTKNEVRQEIEMGPVTFALSQQIVKATTDYPVCKRQYIELISYYNLRLKEFLKLATNANETQGSSLAFAIQQLIEDAMGSPDSHNFLEVMKRYNEQYYGMYDKSYSEEREECEKQLFGMENDYSNESERSKDNFRGKDKNYLVKKFRCLEEIESIKYEINNIALDDRDVKSIELCAASMYDIIKEFNKIAYKRSNAPEIVYKYGYIIHRIIEEAKIFTLLIEIYGAEDKQRLLLQANGEYIELLRGLIDFMGIPFKYNKVELTYEDLHLEFIKKFNFNDELYKTLLINEDLVAFFTHVDIHDENDIGKQIQVVLRYSDKVLQEFQKIPNPNFDKSKGKLIRRIANVRVNCEATYELKKSPKEKDYYMFTIRKATKNLAKLLEIFKQYELSREVYSTIRYVDSVCKLYQIEIGDLRKANLKDNANRTKQFNLRIEYSDYLFKHLRQQEGLKILQETYELAEDMNELGIVKDKLSDLEPITKDSKSNEYQKKLFNEEYFDTFEEEMMKRIDAFSRSADSADSADNSNSTFYI